MITVAAVVVAAAAAFFIGYVLRKRIADRNSRSIGLTNLDRRLRLRYPEETGLRICSIKNLGTSVSFCIPYKKYTPDAPQTGKTE